MKTSVTRLILMAVLALGCGWLVVRTAVIDGSDASTAALAERLAPGNPQIDLAIASSAFTSGVSGQPVVSSEVIQRGHSALRKAPLAAEPFLFDGAAATAAGRNQEGARLLAEALRRNPRSQLTRMLTYQNRLQAGDYERGFRELMDLARFERTLVPKLAPELAKLALIPDIRGPLRRTLPLNPALQDAMLVELVRMGTDAPTILALAGPVHPPAQGAAPPSWHGPFLTALVARGQVPMAYSAWRRFTGISAINGIYDPGFERRAAPPPFNWTFTSGSAGVAEPASGGRLAIEYFGRTPADLARQLLVLRPGRYVLSFDVSSEESNVETGLDIRLRCASDRSIIASLPLPSTGGNSKTVQFAFEVPEGCQGQWLMFAGTPLDVGRSSHVTIGALRLKGASGS